MYAMIKITKVLIAHVLILVAAQMITACAKPNYQNLNHDLNQLCAFDITAYDMCADIIWNTSPKVSENSPFKLNFYTKNNPTILVNPPNDIYVYLWMPDMGHGSSPITLTQTTTGEFMAQDVYFLMNGLWQIRIQFKNGNEILNETAFSISL